MASDVFLNLPFWERLSEMEKEYTTRNASVRHYEKDSN